MAGKFYGMMQSGVCLPSVCPANVMSQWWYEADKSKWPKPSSMQSFNWNQLQISILDSQKLNSSKTMDNFGYSWIIILSVFGILVIGGTCLNRFLANKTENPKKSTRLQQILQSFDIISNTSSILESKRISSGTQVFELLRMISLMWVILGHTILEMMNNWNRNKGADPMFQQSLAGNWFISFCCCGLFAVDFFLFIGGYVSILATKRYFVEIKDQPIWKYPILYIFLLVKRYVRIMPCLAIMALFWMSWMPYLTFNPMRPVMDNNCTPDKF